MQERNYLQNNIHNIKNYEDILKYNLDLIELFKNNASNTSNTHNVNADSEDYRAICTEVQDALKQLFSKIKQNTTEFMFSGEADVLSCFLEIHSGAGGTESDDWAAMLLRMYTRWAERHKYKVSILSMLSGEEAGVKCVTLKIEGVNVYGWLKTESGVHRLVRISPFSSGDKRHTSFASVWVYPMINDDIVIEIKSVDLRIDTYRSSGAGGQHVNTTDSAVRITHIPTNIVVQSQSDRSQHRNKDECMRMLKARLYEMELRKKEERLNEENSAKTDIGWGHQIRSYVLQPYQMIKDLRTNYESSNVTEVLDGDIDNFIKSNLELRLVGKGSYKR